MGWLVDKHHYVPLWLMVLAIYRNFGDFGNGFLIRVYPR